MVESATSYPNIQNRIGRRISDVAQGVANVARRASAAAALNLVDLADRPKVVEIKVCAAIRELPEELEQAQKDARSH
jgi:hypothetical protein